MLLLVVMRVEEVRVLRRGAVGICRRLQAKSLDISGVGDGRQQAVIDESAAVSLRARNAAPDHSRLIHAPTWAVTRCDGKPARSHVSMAVGR
jgi:hypothetical protein